MATVHDDAVYVKGAPETVLDRCESVLTPEGSVPLSDHRRERVETAVSAMTADALRVLAVARKTPDDDDDPETGLTLLGLVGLLDPPREEVQAAVADTRRAGIEVTMITGDAPETAREIARQVGIGTGDGDTATFDVVVTDADAGVGAYNLTVSLANPSAGNIEDVSLPGEPAVDEVTYGDGAVRVRVVGLDTADTGRITVMSVTVEATTNDGSSDIQVDVAALGDENGNEYDVAGTDDARLVVGQSNDQPPTTTTSSSGDSSGQDDDQDTGPVATTTATTTTPPAEPTTTQPSTTSSTTTTQSSTTTATETSSAADPTATTTTAESISTDSSDDSDDATGGSGPGFGPAAAIAALAAAAALAARTRK